MVKNYTMRMNIIRFVSICAIVWVHCIPWTEKKTFSTFQLQFLQAALMQAGRCGTIMFFIISGYFISDKIASLSLTGFIRYRWRSLIMPWIIFLMLITMVQFLQVTTSYQFTHQGVVANLTTVRILLSGNVIHAAYWFIPLSIFTSLFLILFKKHLHKPYFGLILLAITLFYGVNLYYAWLPTNHTKAFLGYAFFMLAGIWLKMRIGQAGLIINRLRSGFLRVALCITFALASLEGIYLKARGCNDAFSSLRISSIIFSLVLFTMLLKSKKLNGINRLKPQAYTYGVYLIHCLLIVLLMPFLNIYISAHGFTDNLYVILSVQVAVFVSVLLLSYLIVALIKISPLYFLFGRDKIGSTKAQPLFQAAVVNEPLRAEPLPVK